MPAFLIPDDFRAFMKAAVKIIDSPSDDRFLDADDALHHECGHGGRIDGIFTYRFNYAAPDGKQRWVVTLEEHQIRDIADGLLIEVEAQRDDSLRVRRARFGDPVLVWGERREHSLRSTSEAELTLALDALHIAAAAAPRMIRIWSVADDQVVAVIWRDECALYVVESVAGYATSVGDKRRTDSFELTDHEGAPLTVPRSDCIDWSIARTALARFAAQGDLDPAIRIEGRIPSVLLMFGDTDRASLISARGEPPATMVESSLPALGPSTIEQPAFVMPALDFVAWADRAVAALRTGELIHVADDHVAGVVAYLAPQLASQGDDACDAIQVADWLVTELAGVPGVGAVVATASDLRTILRRTRDR